MGLHEIVSSPESYINMILREVSTSMLIAYFQRDEQCFSWYDRKDMADISFLFPFIFFFVAYFGIRGREAFLQIE